MHRWLLLGVLSVVLTVKASKDPVCVRVPGGTQAVHDLIVRVAGADIANQIKLELSSAPLCVVTASLTLRQAHPGNIIEKEKEKETEIVVLVLVRSVASVDATDVWILSKLNQC